MQETVPNARTPSRPEPERTSTPVVPVLRNEPVAAMETTSTDSPPSDPQNHPAPTIPAMDESQSTAAMLQQLLELIKYQIHQQQQLQEWFKQFQVEILSKFTTADKPTTANTQVLSKLFGK